MAWNGKQGGNKGGKGTRITGLFKTKRAGLYVGKMRAEEIKGVRVLLKKAADESKEVAVFMYKNDAEEGKPLFSLKCDVQQEFKGKKGNDEDFDDEPNESEDVDL